MTCCGAAIDEAMLDPQKVQQDIEERELLAASSLMENGNRKLVFNIPDMHCGGCISKIEAGLNALTFVIDARANLSLKQVSVIWDQSLGKGRDIKSALNKMGFEHSLLTSAVGQPEENDNQGRELLFALAVAGFAAANIMLLSVSVWSGTNQITTQFFHLISGLIALPAVSFAGKPFFRSALGALSAKRLNMDVPISLAVLLALGMSIYESFNNGAEAYFDAAVTLLFFLLIGRYLDHLMREKARNAVNQLSKLISRGSTLIYTDGTQDYVKLEDIKPGMVLRIRAGERVPVDCELISNETDIDRALVSGESMSVLAKKGDALEAGILNLTGTIDVMATSTAETSFLAEIRKMIEVAENGRGQYIRIADRMAQIYAPAVHLLAFISFMGWMVVTAGDFHTSLYVAIAVLIITCPCALGLAVPVAHVIGASRLMKNGILLRDGSAFERMENIDTVIFDKTGTLTKGEPNVVRVYGNKEEGHVSLASSLAASSSHPLARATSKYFGMDTSVQFDKITEHAGKGVEAVYKGRKVRFGKPGWVKKISSPNYPWPEIKNTGSCSAFALQGHEPMLLEFEDELRQGAKQTIAHLDKSGFSMGILSGDRKPVVAHLAHMLGIKKFSAECDPAAKVKYLDGLQRQGAKVLMVGDGLNDAPALAAGYVSMAPSTACDVGKMSADFVFTGTSLESLVTALEVSKRVGRIVKQNFGIALVYNAIAIPMAMAGFITPLIAALAMSASSILVVANSMRIHELNFSDRKKQRHEAVDTSQAKELAA